MTPEQFIDELSLHFPPRHDDPATAARWLEHVLSGLRGADPAALEQACRTIIQTRKFRGFPLLSEMREAIGDAVASKPNPERFETKYPGWSKRDHARADGMLDSEMGRRAADEGWVLGFHDFCRINRRMPTAIEAREIRHESRLFDEAYSECCRGEMGPLSASLRRLGDLMLKKREKYAAMAHGEIIED